MRLVAAYITENDCVSLQLSLKAILKEVDKVYIVHSRTEGDKTEQMLQNLGTDKIVYLEKQYLHEDKGANGKQRNWYLDLIKHHEEECFVIVLDSDEVVDDIEKLKEFIQQEQNKNRMFNVHMRHLVGDFQHEDSTLEKHYCPRRLFYYKKGDDLSYPEVEHPILTDNLGNKTQDICNTICIWHLAYAKHVFDLYKKYKNHLTKIHMHTPEGLKHWYYMHVFGIFPRKVFKITELPQSIVDHFELQDAINFEYFRERKLEAKHFVDFGHWRDFFKPKEVLMIGDGLGHRSFAGITCGVDVDSFELSQWAVDHCPYKELKERFEQGDVLTYKTEKKYDLVVAYDILEHLEYKDLEKAIANMYKWTNKYVLISVPVIGDPNLENDPTHKIRLTKEQWTEKVQNIGFKIVEVPEHFLYRNQLIIGEK